MDSSDAKLEVPRLPPLQRRTALLVTSLAAAAVAGGASAPAAAPMANRASRNVRDYGAMGDGVTDDTEAFNRATQADAEWSPTLATAILVPAGRYRITDSVYLRRGQSLLGEGVSTLIDAGGARGSTFILGRRRSGAARGEADPGGLPVLAASLLGLGGNAEHGFFYISVEGFQLRNLFLSAVGLGLEIEASDGIVSDVAIDQCLSGVHMRRSQNNVFQNLNIFSANYGITFGELCRDIVVANAIFSYTRYASVLLAENATDITSIKLANCTFTSNEQYETFIGHIHSRATRSDIQISSCTFRNMPGPAIWQGTGVGLTVDMHNCILDGRRTNPTYAQSGRSSGIRTGHGSFFINGCNFRNLQAEAIQIAAGLERLTVEGGAVDGGLLAIKVDDGVSGALTVRNMQGMAEVRGAAEGHSVLLPDLGPRTHWQLDVVSRDPNAGVPSARFTVSNRRGRPTWHSGAPDGTGAKLRQAADGRLSLLLPRAQFGDATPAVEASAYA